MATLELSETEAIDALYEATRGATGPKGAKTVKEFARASKMGDDWVRAQIGSLAMQDRVAVFRVQRVAIDGTMRSVPAYIVLPPKGKGGRKK